MALILGMMTYSSFYVALSRTGRCWECLPIPLEVGWLILERTFTYIMNSRLAVSLDRIVDRDKKHPGEEASGC